MHITSRLNAATEDMRLLDHPFYKAWAEGDLTVEDLRFYSTQYFRQVEAFPGYLANLAERLPSAAAREVVLANRRDEVDDDHAGLWLRFAETVGAGETEVRTAEVEPETRACVEAFDAGTSGPSAAFGLGMLYGYESQTPAVAETKVAGLREHYGIDGPGLDYFLLHGELDVEHSAELAGAIQAVATDEVGLADAEAGARAGAAAIWGLLDGVARVRAIA